MKPFPLRFALTGLSLFIMSVSFASAEWLKPVSAEDHPFGKDIYVGAYSNDDWNWGVSVAFTNNFVFDANPGVGINIGDVTKKGAFFSGLLELHKIRSDEELAPGGHGLEFSASTKTLQSCELIFETEYQKEPLSIWLSFAIQDGQPIGYKVKVKGLPTTKAEQGVAPQSATRAESNSEGNDKPQPESEARSR